MGKVGAQVTMSLDGGFRFVNGLDQALAPAREAAEPKDVGIMGGADGSAKRLFEGFDKDVELEQVGVVQSPWVTHLRYRVLPA